MNHRPWHGRSIGGRTYFARRLRPGESTPTPSSWMTRSGAAGNASFHPTAVSLGTSRWGVRERGDTGVGQAHRGRHTRLVLGNRDLTGDAEVRAQKVGGAPLGWRHDPLREGRVNMHGREHGRSPHINGGAGRVVAPGAPRARGRAWGKTQRRDAAAVGEPAHVPVHIPARPVRRRRAVRRFRASCAHRASSKVVASHSFRGSRSWGVRVRCGSGTLSIAWRRRAGGRLSRGRRVGRCALRERHGAMQRRRRGPCSLSFGGLR